MVYLLHMSFGRCVLCPCVVRSVAHLILRHERLIELHEEERRVASTNNVRDGERRNIHRFSLDVHGSNVAVEYPDGDETLHIGHKNYLYHQLLHHTLSLDTIALPHVPWGSTLAFCHPIP